MNTFRLVCYLIISFTLLLGGCTLNLSFDGHVTITDDKASVLPSPKQPNGEEPVPTGNEPPLDEAQQVRQAEVDEYILKSVYGGGQIVASYQLPTGDIVDFIARDSLPPLPYDPPPLPFAPGDLPPGIEHGLTELEQFPDLVAMAATATPFHRPAFWPYVLGLTDATSIEDYLSRYQIGGQLFGAEHLYAGIETVQPQTIYGVTGSINQFRPEVADGSFSLIELAVGCPADNPEEVVGIVISVDKVNGFGPKKQKYMDGEPRLHVEYAHKNAATDQVEYRWDRDFTANPFRTHQLGETVPVSEVGGTQMEHEVAIIHMPGFGDWWFMYNGDVLGYFSGSLFTQLHAGACKAAWYLETARWKPDPSDPPKPWPNTEGGSGNFPDAGLGNVAYVRNPKYFDSYTSGFGVDAKIDKQREPYKPLCYQYKEAYWGAHRLIVMGGPGGMGQGCTGP